MKHTIIALLAVLVSCAAFAHAQTADDKPDPNFYIYLCFGQSNMEGVNKIPASEKQNVDSRFRVLAAYDFPQPDRKMGQWYPAVPPLCRQYTGLCPADYFGRTMVANLPQNVRVGVVVVAVGGCRIELFQQDHAADYLKSAPGFIKKIATAYGNDPYQRLVDMAKIAQKSGVIKGILLHQGESNPNDHDWPNKVKGIYDQLIEDLKLDPKSVPLLAGEMMQAEYHGACAPMNRIIDTLPQTLPNSYVISSKDCPGQPDHLHFTVEGYRTLGTHYAEQMLSLMNLKADVKPAAAANAASTTTAPAAAH